MIKSWSLLVLLAPFPVFAQQGFMPLSRTVDAPWTALMHSPNIAAHSAIRPYLREDLVALTKKDTILPPLGDTWLTRLADPDHRMHGGPLIDVLAGASTREADVLKYRMGAGAWVEWNLTDGSTLT